MISRRLLARTVASQLISGASKKRVTQQLAAYIVTHKLHKQVEMIVADIEHELAKQGMVQATVTTAHPLSAGLRTQLHDYIQSSTAASMVVIDEEIDASIIGGVIVQTPDKTLDLSIATQLRRLKTT